MKHRNLGQNNHIHVTELRKHPFLQGVYVVRSYDTCIDTECPNYVSESINQDSP